MKCMPQMPVLIHVSAVLETAVREQEPGTGHPDAGLSQRCNQLLEEARR